jgi:hypothetical protein
LRLSKISEIKFENVFFLSNKMIGRVVLKQSKVFVILCNLGLPPKIDYNVNELITNLNFIVSVYKLFLHNYLAKNNNFLDFQKWQK